MRFEFWPLWQCWAVWPIQILFSRQGRLKIFLAGFIKYLNFNFANFGLFLWDFILCSRAKLMPCHQEGHHGFHFGWMKLPYLHNLATTIIFKK